MFVFIKKWVWHVYVYLYVYINAVIYMCVYKDIYTNIYYRKINIYFEID